MAHLAPVARWFGFGFGYAVAEAVALTAIGLVAGPWAAVAAARYLNAVFALFAIGALARLVWSMWRTRRQSRAGQSGRVAPAAPAGLGTFAKSKSHALDRSEGEPLGIGA